MIRGTWLTFPAAVAVALGFLVAAPAPRADAKPEYAKKEGKDCAFCHTNPKGGGPRNPKGEEYAKNGHKFLPTAKGYGEDQSFSSEANGKTFALVRVAMNIGHYKYAIAKLKSLDGKERSTAGKQLILNTFPTIDGKGGDLLKVAKDAVTNGMVKDASEALARVETEFAGRDVAKDVPKVREGLLKLAGGPEANKAALGMEPQRILYFDALMRTEEGDQAGGVKALQDFVAKYPDSPFASEAKTKIQESSKPAPKGG